MKSYPYPGHPNVALLRNKVIIYLTGLGKATDVERPQCLSHVAVIQERSQAYRRKVIRNITKKLKSHRWSEFIVCHYNKTPQVKNFIKEKGFFNSWSGG